MKKILTILALASVATFVHAQGTVILQQSNAGFLVSTNGAGNVTGPTTKTAGTFDYAVLTAAFGGPAPSSNPLDAAWSGAALTGVNFTITAGGINGEGGVGGAATAAGTWGAPTGGSYTDATERYFIIVGWSSTYASTWATFAPLLQAGLAPGGYYGTSAEGFGYSGGGPATLPAPSLFNPSTGMPGALTGGFTLNLVQAVPEPATIALASLGGLSLLAFRRRNKA